MILEQYPRTIVGIFVVLLLLTSSLTAVITTTPATHSAFASSSTGIIVPLYSYPGSYWNQVIQAKNAHPSVPIIAIINPNSGPGTASDSNYVSGIKNLQAAGITVLGYVYTSYAARSISTAESDVSSYKNWYNVNGIMFDEMSNVAGNENYYSTLTQYVKSHGMTMTVGNPGTSTRASYIGTVDNITVYESSGAPSASTLATRTFYPTYPSSDFSSVSYGVSTLDTTAETNDSPYVSYLYITNDALSNPYDTVPLYFSSEVGALDAGITTTVSQPPTNLVATAASSQINLSWLSPSSNGGSSITGYKIERSVDGGATWSAIVLNSGSTATTYSDIGLQSSTTYTYRVSAINSVGTSNPSNTASATIAAILTSPTITLNPTSGSAGSSITVTGTNFASSSGITVSYDGSAVSTNPGTIATSSGGGFSATFTEPAPTTGTHTVTANDASSDSASTQFTVTSLPPTTTVSLGVKSADLSGNSFGGMWTELHASNGTTLVTGYTPIIFNLNAGVQYTVYVANYQNFVFNHWDDGSANPSRNVAITQSGTITAYYSTSAAAITPQPPTGLTANAISSSQINLGWAAPSGTVTGYMIERSTDGGATWGTILSNTGTTATTYSITGLSPSTTYSYRVSAINSVGTSSPSNTVSATTASTTTTGTTAVVTVKAVTAGGNVLHIYTLLKNSAGTTVSNGYTPIGFTINTNTNYLIKVDNYHSHKFQYWQDQPSNTGPTRPINISQSTTIVAVFS